MLKINRNKQTVTAKIIDNETNKTTRSVKIECHNVKLATEYTAWLRRMHKLHDKTQWEVLEMAEHECMDYGLVK